MVAAIAKEDKRIENEVLTDTVAFWYIAQSAARASGP